MNEIKNGWLAIGVGVLLAIGGGMVGHRAAAQSGPATAPAKGADAGDEIVAAIDDLISVSVADLTPSEAKTTVTPRVDPQGRIVLLMVGQIDVAGKTMEQIKAAVQKAYVDRGLLRGPDVSVTRLEEAAKATIRSAPIAEGETLKIRIWDLVPDPGATQFEAKVVNKAISMPRLDAVQVAGETEAGAARAIARAYRDRQLLRETRVEVLRIRTADAPQN